jgi:hypothetical protein
LQIVHHRLSQLLGETRVVDLWDLRSELVGVTEKDDSLAVHEVCGNGQELCQIHYSSLIHDD